MQAQRARGNDVSYFCSGRHYPLVRPHVRERMSDGVRVCELVNSPVVIGPLDRGTRAPDRDLESPRVERLFREVVEAVRPDIVHVQELGGLASSILEVPRERGVPVCMTLHDYFPLCPTIKLFDADGRVCLRRAPAPQCARCCRDAPHGLEAVVDTLGHHRRGLEKRLPLLARMPRPRELARRWRSAEEAGGDPADGSDHAEAPPGLVAQIPAYQRRRDVNVARLNRVDRLVAVSDRVAEIYTDLGVDATRIQTMHLTLDHLDSLRPRRFERVGSPLRLATLAGCSTTAKGAGVVVDALERLQAMGFAPDDLVLAVAGQVDPAVADRLWASPLARAVGAYGAGELDSLLDGFDVGIVPSIWEEAYGFVGVEFLAKGIPVIGNAAGGIPEYTRPGETGWLNEGCSGEGLAAIIAAIVRDPGQVVALNASILGLRSRLVKPMSLHAGELERLYDDVIAQTSKTAASSG